MPKLLIAASGTGGHIYPALAVANALPDTWQSRWIGVPDRLETKLIPEKYKLITIRAGGFQKGLSDKVLRLLQVISGSFRITFIYSFLGSTLIYGVNIIRIAFLSVMLYKFPSQQEFLHDIIFTTIIYGLVFLLWVLWVQKFSKY